jgi:hypothetical protein
MRGILAGAAMLADFLNYLARHYLCDSFLGIDLRQVGCSHAAVSAAIVFSMVVYKYGWLINAPHNVPVVSAAYLCNSFLGIDLSQVGCSRANCAFPCKIMLCSVDPLHVHLHATSLVSDVVVLLPDNTMPCQSTHPAMCQLLSADYADVKDVFWVLLQDGHTTVSWYQLSHWEDCPKWDGFTASAYTAGSTTVSFANPCEYFTVGAYVRNFTS